jgi:hypothetical protein
MDNATAANVLSGLLFFGFVYYVMLVPMIKKKKGIEEPKLVDRIKRDVKLLVEKIKATFALFKK